MKIKNSIITLLLALGLGAQAIPQAIAGEGHAEEGHDEGSELTLDTRQTEAAGIETSTLQIRELNHTLRVPAEVVINAYQSARVTPRIQAQVVARHVKLGEHVKQGQPLVTLSSVAMAEAQGQLIVADLEWQRVKSLGRSAVGARRYIEAQVARQQAYARVLAFGMQTSQVDLLLKTANASKATGEFDLLAPLAGTVLSDAFIVGELIEPGRVLFDISDESVLWVEARVNPNTLAVVKVGDPARVRVNQGPWIEGEVIQLHHSLSETTRTQSIRIAVENRDDLLHPGEFAEAEILTGSGLAALAVPNRALTLIEGQPAVFKLEDGGSFHPQTVETGPVVGDWTVIHAGLEAGDEIAVEGVFHLKSLLLKSSLGEGHAH